jgi:hypothetical protein
MLVLWNVTPCSLDLIGAMFRRNLLPLSLGHLPRLCRQEFPPVPITKSTRVHIPEDLLSSLLFSRLIKYVLEVADSFFGKHPYLSAKEPG